MFQHILLEVSVQVCTCTYGEFESDLLETARMKRMLGKGRTSLITAFYRQLIIAPLKRSPR